MRAWLWALILLILASLPGAMADVDGDCTVSINGNDLAGHSAEGGTPIAVPENGTIEYNVTSHRPMVHWTLWASYAGTEVKIDERTFDDGVMAIQGKADASEFAWAGTGVYRVRGEAVHEDGDVCGAEALLHLHGSLLNATTVVAAAALLGGTVGLVWMLVNILAQVRDVKEAIEDFRDGYKEA